MGKVGEEASIPTQVTITPTVTTSTEKDSMGFAESTFSLALVMMPSRSITIPLAMEQTEGDAAMKRLNPGLYEGSGVIAAYEYYYAGGGFQVVVRQVAGALVFEKRNTSEGSEEVAGGCDKWTNVGTLPIDSNTKVIVDDKTLTQQDKLVISCKM
jgi:hypothetical protein